MSKNFIWLVTFVLFSCNKNNLEESIICGKNEYWKYTDDCYNPKGLYFKFNNDYSCDRYLAKPISEGRGFDLFNKDNDIEFEDKKWSIVNDSTFLWGDGYEIEFFSNDTIALSFQYLKDKRCNVRLIKVYDSLLRKVSPAPQSLPTLRN